MRCSDEDTLMVFPKSSPLNVLTGSLFAFRKFWGFLGYLSGFGTDNPSAQSLFYHFIPRNFQGTDLNLVPSLYTEEIIVLNLSKAFMSWQLFVIPNAHTS